MADIDPAASALDGIRENFAMRSKHAQGLGANPADFRRLLAAVEAARSFHVEAVITDQPEPFRYCRTCSGHPAWPRPEVAAVRAELLREAGGRD